MDFSHVNWATAIVTTASTVISSLLVAGIILAIRSLWKRRRGRPTWRVLMDPAGRWYVRNISGRTLFDPKYSVALNGDQFGELNDLGIERDLLAGSGAYFGEFPEGACLNIEWTDAGRRQALLRSTEKTAYKVRVR